MSTLVHADEPTLGHALVPTRTLAADAVVQGVSLFRAVRTSVTIKPAAADTGLVFRRTDLAGNPEIRSSAHAVREESRRTVLVQSPQSQGSPSVETVEHLLSALAGMGISDARIDVHGPELPIGDGSAMLFVEAINAVGVVPNGGSVPALTIAQTIRIEGEHGAWIEAQPPLAGDAPALVLEYQIDYSGAPGVTPAVRASLCGERSFRTEAYFERAGSAKYQQDIAPARTFSLAAEAEAARKMGLFAHLSPREMLVIGPEGPIENILRFPDEPVRHKVLDLLGDLGVAGRPIIGRIVAHKTGHAMNNRLARMLFDPK